MPPVGRGRTGVLVLVQRQLLLRSVQEKLSLSGIKESRAGGSRIEHVPTHSDSGVDAVLSDLQSGQFPVLRRRDMNDDELDLDGDGIADVVVPGLTARALPTTEMSSTAPYVAVAEAQMPPESSPYSPMGQIDHMGYALRSQTARTGWRRRVIRVAAVICLVLFVGFIASGLFASVR